MTSTLTIENTAICQANRIQDVFLKQAFLNPPHTFLFQSAKKNEKIRDIKKRICLLVTEYEKKDDLFHLFELAMAELDVPKGRLFPKLSDQRIVLEELSSYLIECMDILQVTPSETRQIRTQLLTFFRHKDADIHLKWIDLLGGNIVVSLMSYA